MRVEMCHGKNYHYKDQLYRRFAEDGKTPLIYEVDGVLAAELIKLSTKRDIPYFRLLLSEEELEQQEAEREEVPDPVIKVTRNPEKDNPPASEPNVVKVKSKVKKKAKKKIIKKKAPVRTTASDEGEDNSADEV